jgi:hypothetical protein
MTNDPVPTIEIPDATAEPAAYVRALIDTLGDRDPLEVYETTAGERATTRSSGHNSLVPSPPGS